MALELPAYVLKPRMAGLSESWAITTATPAGISTVTTTRS